MLINCYMPCDSYSRNSCKEEFLEVMDVVECIVSQNSDCDIVFGGDLNLDLSRNFAHDLYFKQAIERLSLIDLWILRPATDRYTYIDLNQNAFSCIDHITVSTALANRLVTAEPLHEAFNPSKHSAIVASSSLLSKVHPVHEQVRNTPAPRPGPWGGSGGSDEPPHSAAEFRSKKMKNKKKMQKQPQNCSVAICEH